MSAPRDWLRGEPTVDEMLADPIVRAMMGRAGVSADDIEKLLKRLTKRRSSRKTIQRQRQSPRGS
jgi:hypothetical protein